MGYFTPFAKWALPPILSLSLVSCSLLGPGEDPDSWGDPNWEMGQARNCDNHNSTGSTADGDAPRGLRRLIASSHRERAASPARSPEYRPSSAANSDDTYWPTTQELENRGGNLTFEDYDQTANLALNGSSRERSPSAAPFRSQETPHMSQLEPELPAFDGTQNAEDSDPLAGFWDDDDGASDIDTEDFTDSEIQPAGKPQESQPIMADTMTAEATERIDPPIRPEAPGDDGQRVFMPIPPTPAPPGRTAVSANARIANHRGNSDLKDVITLTPKAGVAPDDAFESVSILNDQDEQVKASLAAPSTGSILRRRERVSLANPVLTTPDNEPLSPATRIDAPALRVSSPGEE